MTYMYTHKTEFKQVNSDKAFGFPVTVTPSNVHFTPLWSKHSLLFPPHPLGKHAHMGLHTAETDYTTSQIYCYCCRLDVS